MVVDLVVDTVTDPAFLVGLAAAFGWQARKSYFRWRYGEPMDSVDVVNHALAYQLIADRAIDFLDPAEREALEKSVQRDLEESFGEDVEFEVFDRD